MMTWRWRDDDVAMACGHACVLLQGAPGFSAKYEAAAQGFDAMAAEAQTQAQVLTGNKRMQRTSSHNCLVREASVSRPLPCAACVWLCAQSMYVGPRVRRKWTLATWVDKLGACSGC